MRNVLRCTVRGCGRALSKEERRWVCEQKHSFDIARAGYVNLLQPQDKKALAPEKCVSLWSMLFPGMTFLQANATMDELKL